MCEADEFLNYFEQSSAAYLGQVTTHLPETRQPIMSVDGIRRLYTGFRKLQEQCQLPENQYLIRLGQQKAILRLRVADAQAFMYQLHDGKDLFHEDRKKAINDASYLIPLHKIVLDLWQN